VHHAANLSFFTRAAGAHSEGVRQPCADIVGTGAASERQMRMRWMNARDHGNADSETKYISQGV